MKPMAMVIKTYGDANVSTAIAHTFESAELKKLRAQVDVSSFGRNNDYHNKVRAARRKYRIKPMSPFKRKLWGAIGLAVLLIKGA